MPKHVLIRELQPNQLLEGVYAVNNCQLGQTRNGKPYLKCLLSDRSGRLPGRMWNCSDEIFQTLPTDGFVWFAGQSQPYQGEMQIIVQQIQPAEPTPEELAELLPSTPFDVEQMFAELTAVMGTIKNEPLTALVKMYLDDEPLMRRFKAAPAAMMLHHAYLGGLLEHTLNLLKIAELILPRYPRLNRDLVLAGLFLHDLGKCQELTWERGFGYSDDGQLVGHVARGILWLQRKAEDSAAMGHKVPEPLLRVLHHIILSHHGKAEFGALKIPATPEAIAVSLIDNLDAKLHMAITAGRPDGGPGNEAVGGNFTEKIWALETRVFRPDPTTLKDEGEP